MCNLYSMSKGQQAIRELAGAMRDTTGNLPMLPGIFPDYAAPIVPTGADGARELVMARWGTPSPAFAPLNNVTVRPPTQTCPCPSCMTFTRPFRPMQVPCVAT